MTLLRELIEIPEHVQKGDFVLRLSEGVSDPAELLPWLKQWHNEVDAEFGTRMGDSYEGFVQDEARQMGRTIEEVRAWQPPARKASRKAAKTPRRKEV